MKLEVCKVFVKVGWAKFLTCFQGNDTTIALDFMQNFTRTQALVQQLAIMVNKEIIAVVTKFSWEGEAWSNNFKFSSEY